MWSIEVPWSVLCLHLNYHVYSYLNVLKCAIIFKEQNSISCRTNETNSNSCHFNKINLYVTNIKYSTLLTEKLPDCFSKKHNAFCFSAYSMHFAYNFKQSVSLHRNCIKITSVCVKSFSSWRIVKQSIADFASKTDIRFFTLLEAKNINNFHCLKILFLKKSNFEHLIILYVFYGKKKKHFNQ